LKFVQYFHIVMIGNGNTYNKYYTDVVGFVAAFYELRSVIKHATNKTKMRPGDIIDHYHMIAMLY